MNNREGCFKHSFLLSNVRSVRPGYGLHPKCLEQILGKKVSRDLEMGTRFKLDYLELI